MDRSKICYSHFFTFYPVDYQLNIVLLTYSDSQQPFCIQRVALDGLYNAAMFYAGVWPTSARSLHKVLFI